MNEETKPQPKSLVEKLQDCKSKKQAREVISQHCEEQGTTPEKLQLTADHYEILQHLR